MVSSRDCDIGYDNTMKHTIKNGCLCVLVSASMCQMKTKKSPQLRGLRCDLMLSGASVCWMQNHSHSMVAGGLLEIS